ncbi:Plug domain-containing protein [Parabacteroides gordonii]|uniref:Plug domain-containing protein n=1 Tax=Parabacteroides gordonii TaxID=574930 RepID=UPI0026EF8716|nr:Plug domain-containing protein [Parabacteroides gordonii]
MKSRLTYVVLLFSWHLNAQMIELPAERIYLSLDRSFYNIGDMMTVSAQLFGAGRKQAALSEYIYVELFNSQDSVLLRKKVRCIQGEAVSFPIQLDYFWSGSVFYLRAYTRLMQNFRPETYPIVEIPIGQPLIVASEQVLGVRCSFFPEGGQWMNGEVQNMTVYLTDDHGNPLSTPFHILNHTDTVAGGTSFSSGMQTIRLHPKEGDEFCLSVKSQGEHFLFPLPLRQEERHTLQAVINRNKIYYKVISAKEPIKQERLFVYYAGMGLEEISLTEKQRSGIISVADGEDGLFILALTDQQGNIISQTALWKKKMQPELSLEKSEYTSGEALRLLVDLQENSSVYCRVVESNQLASSAITQSELGSELASPVPFPSSYLAASSKDVWKETEAWMRTTRWVRFHLPDVVRKDFKYTYQPETILQFTGKVTFQSDKSLKDGTIVAYNAETDEVNEGTISEQGRYTIPVSDFLEGNHFFLQAHPAKGKAGFYKYIPDDDTFPLISNPFLQNRIRRKYAETTAGYQDSTDFFYQVDEAGNRDYIMPEITVKARSRQEKHVSTEKFYKMNHIDEEVIDKRNYSRLEDIIEDMPGVNIVYSSEVAEGQRPIPILKSLRGVSTVHGGESTGIPILVDGVRMNLQEAFDMISPQQIKSVEFLKPWQTNAVTFGAIDGALSITTKGMKKENVVSKGFFYYPMGLTIGEAYSKSPAQAPSAPGEYDLLVDVITKENAVYSYRLPFTVKR